MDMQGIAEEQEFQRATQECQIQLPPPPNDVMWRHFFLSLYDEVINSEENEKRRYRERVWDFCVIHSNHPTDHETARNFVRLLETSLGISGRSLGDVALGENTLDAASTMVQGSTKVFILASRYFENDRVPKFVFQSALMQQLENVSSSKQLENVSSSKIVPVLPGPDMPFPFSMGTMKGFKLSDDSKTVELVKEAITPNDRIYVKETRDKHRRLFDERLDHLRKKRFQEIRDKIATLRKEYGDQYDPTQQDFLNTQQTIEVVDSVTLDGDQTASGGPVIKISQCQGVTIGPSFHFHGSQSDDEDISNINFGSSPSSTSSNFDSSAYFSP